MKSIINTIEKFVFSPFKLTKTLYQTITKLPDRAAKIFPDKPKQFIARTLAWVLIIFGFIFSLAVYKSIIISGNIAVAAEETVKESAEKLSNLGQAGVISVESFATRVSDNLTEILTSTQLSLHEIIQMGIDIVKITVETGMNIVTSMFGRAVEILEEDTTITQKIIDFSKLIIQISTDFVTAVVNINVTFFLKIFQVVQLAVTSFVHVITSILSTAIHAFI